MAMQYEIDLIKGTQRHDRPLLGALHTIGNRIHDGLKLLDQVSRKRRVRDREEVLARTRQRIQAAEHDACELFEIGAEWLRKYNALETLLGPAGNEPDMSRFAALFFAYTRFFETGLPALDSICVKLEQCEACRKETGVPHAILVSNLVNLHQGLADLDTYLAERVRSLKLIKKEG